MYDPAHPGEVLRELYLEPLQLTITDAAKALGVTRNTFLDLVKGRSRVSTPMALRLAKAFEPQQNCGLTCNRIMSYG